MRRISLALMTAVCAVIGPLGPTARAASAVSLVYTAGPQSTNGWTVPVMAVPQGASLTFLNLDIASHDFVSAAYGPDTNTWCTAFEIGKCPLFWSRLVGLSGMASVEGLDALVPGQIYTFICTRHTLMRGTLIALPALPA